MHMENARVAGPRREVSHRRNQRTLTRARGLESYDLTRTQFDPVSIDATPVLSTLVWNGDSIFALWARFVKDRHTDSCWPDGLRFKITSQVRPMR
mgnify:CR=1 FL=1